MAASKSRSLNSELRIVKDSREQFAPPWSEGVTCVRAKLEFGDFSAVGLTDKLALEVKWSLDDLAACCGRERDRFDSMLRGLARYPMRALIVAAATDDVKAHRYESRMLPKSIIGSTMAWMQDYAVPCIWARSPLGATRCIEWWCRRATRKAAEG